MPQIPRPNMGTARVVKTMQSTDQPQRQEPPLMSAGNHNESTFGNVETPKKFMRKRHTRDERQLISQQCFDRYQQGWSSKLIAHDLGIRESFVKESLYEFLHEDKNKIIKTNVFLASANTRMKDIDVQNVAEFYVVEVTEDGTRICRPLTGKSDRPNFSI